MFNEINILVVEIKLLKACNHIPFTHCDDHETNCILKSLACLLKVCSEQGKLFENTELFKNACMNGECQHG
jgi:hypothetical protein